MSDESVFVFLALVRALNEGDLDRLLELTLADVVLRPLAPCLRGEYRGHVGVRALWADRERGCVAVQLHHRYMRGDLGDRVLALGTLRMRRRADGVVTQQPSASVAVFKDGKLTRWDDFSSKQRALEAVGLSEQPATGLVAEQPVQDPLRLRHARRLLRLGAEVELRLGAAGRCGARSRSRCSARSRSRRARRSSSPGDVHWPSTQDAVGGLAGLRVDATSGRAA